MKRNHLVPQIALTLDLALALALVPVLALAVGPAPAPAFAGEVPELVAPGDRQMYSTLFLVGLVGYWWRRKRWRALAAELGLELAPRGLRVTGQWSGRSATVQIYDRNEFEHHNESGTAWATYVGTGLEAAIPWKIRISREGLGAKLTKLVGADDVETGDAEFDGRFFVQSEAGEPTQRLLDAELRRQLLATFAEDPDLMIAENRVYREWRGKKSDAGRFRETLDRQARLAEAIEAALARTGQRSA